MHAQQCLSPASDPAALAAFASCRCEKDDTLDASKHGNLSVCVREPLLLCIRAAGREKKNVSALIRNCKCANLLTQEDGDGMMMIELEKEDGRRRKKQKKQKRACRGMRRDWERERERTARLQARNDEKEGKSETTFQLNEKETRVL